MKLARTAQFARDFAALPEAIEKRTEKQLRMLAENPRHPSLRVKKMEGIADTWEARVTAYPAGAGRPRNGSRHSACQ